MKFYDVSKIMDNINVHNKYLLTSVISQRARQISEMKSRRVGSENEGAPEPEEKAISLALEDMERGNVHVELRAATITGAIEEERGANFPRDESSAAPAPAAGEETVERTSDTGGA